MLLRCAVLLTAVISTALANPPTERSVGVRWVSQALAEAMMDFAPNSDNNPECNLHSSLYLQGLANSTLWAVQMLDSATLSVGGLLTGDAYALGHYDQCLDVYVPETRLRGQHCLATLRYAPSPAVYPQYYAPPNATYYEPSPQSPVWEKVKVTLYPGVTRRDLFHWAVCVPASCSVDDIQHSLRLALEPVFKRHGLEAAVTVDPEYCHVAGDKEIPPTIGYISVRVVILLLLIISGIATVYDYVMPYYRDQKFESALAEVSEKVLLAFSVRRNVHELTEKGVNPKLDVINGGKVISIAAILFGHRILYSHGLALYNHQFWEERLENHFVDNALMNATHLVDVFFVCSGLLAFLGVHKALEKRKSINFIQAILLRWLRIVPTYLLMMGVVGWLLPHMSDGPLWHKRVGLESRRCQENWWLNLLFINNYVHADNQCLLLSWYLACDMQFFVIGIFAIYVLWRWPRIGYALFGVLFVASVAIPFYVTYDRHYSGTLKLYASSLLVDPFSNEHFNSMYVKSHNRAGPYIVGVLTAYLMVTLSAANYKFSKKTIVLGFLLFFGGGYAHQTYGFLFYQKDRPYNLLENAIYAGFHRITFSIGVAWIALTHYTTGFGAFKTILAHPIYTPLCRLVYSTVLIHTVIQLAEASSVRHSEHMNYPKLFWMACGDYFIANLLALPLYLMVEAPCRTIVKFLFVDRNPNSVQKQSQNVPTEMPAEQPRQVVVSRL